jgi:dTDP-4-dehydrorhamnose reductase
MDTSNIKILLLGHNGMLGSMVLAFLKSNGIEIEIISDRWPSQNFKEKVLKSNANFAINCIASIPQKTNSKNNFKKNNYSLPLFMFENFNGKIIHPSSDAELNSLDNTEYIKTKRQSTKEAVNKKNVYIIQTSIIGPEKQSGKSLWSWLEKNTKDSIFGYTNSYWNGITTLEFSKICLNILTSKNPLKITRPATRCISKYNLLKLLNNKLKLKKKIIPVTINEPVYNCVECNFKVFNLEKQIDELLIFRKNTKI